MKRRLSTLICSTAGVVFLCLISADSGLSQKQVVKPIRQVTVVDSTGKVVGVTVGGMDLKITEMGEPLEFRPTVLLEVQQNLVAINVARNRLYAGTVWFQSNDCTGTAWMQAPNSVLLALLAPARIGPPGQTVYVAAEGSPPQSITANSQSSGVSCTRFTTEVIAIPGQPLLDLQTVFTPPFSVRSLP